MAGKIEDIELLEKLQEIDKILAEGEMVLNNPPLKEKIDSVRAKKAEFKAKRDQIDQIFVKSRKEIELLSTKDSELAASQNKAQKEIEETQGDYRKIEAYTNNLNQLTQQRKVVDEKLEKIEANFNKIKDLKQKIEDNIGKLSMQEDDFNSTLQKDQAEWKIKTDKASSEKENLVAKISPDSLRIYDRAKKIVGNIVLAQLEGQACSVCRNPISNASFSKIKNEAPISVCPNCSRVIVVKE